MSMQQFSTKKLTPEEKRCIDSHTQLAKAMTNTQQWDFVRALKDQDLPILRKVCEGSYAPVAELRLSSNRRPTIVNDISNIKWSNLRMLDLGSNMITTIQPITTLYLPVLERLNLYNNLVTNFSPLRRLSTPNLMYLTVQSNPSTNTLGCLSEMRLANMNWLWLEHKEKQTVMNQGMQWLAKLECQALGELVLKSKLRMRIQVVEHAIRNRFSQAKIIMN